MPHDPERMRQAEQVAEKIKAMVKAEVDTFDRRLRIQGYQPEHRTIILEALAHEALVRSLEVKEAPANAR